MLAYRYEAIDIAGKVSKGVINADNPRSARSDLRARSGIYGYGCRRGSGGSIDLPLSALFR